MTARAAIVFSEDASTRHAPGAPGRHRRDDGLDQGGLQRRCPAESFETGIRKTVQWYLDHADWVAQVQSGAYRDWIADHYSAEPQ